MISEEMMRFFKECREELPEWLPEEYAGAAFELREVPKNNSMRASIVVTLDNERVSPNVYIDQIFDRYMDDGDLDKALSELSDTIVYGFTNKPEVDVDNAFYTDNIIPCLINTKTNRHILDNAPHIEYFDLSLYFRGVIQFDSENLGTFIVSNEMAKRRGLDVNGLREIADKYVKEENNYFVTGIMEILTGEPADDEIMYVVTNRSKLFGAAGILDNDVLEDIRANKFNTDKLIIIPSSVHECIVMDGNCMDAKSIQEMVTEVNATQVAPDEVLSASVYSYTKEGGLDIEVEKELSPKEIANDKKLERPVMGM